jgi:biopolymer transport protein ExbB
MTALGLAVAVPAVLAYNWLQRRNKSIAENLGAFSVDVLGYMVSGGQVKPTNTVTAAAKPAVSTPAPATKKA